MKHNDRLPKKSILRKTNDKNHSLNQNHTLVLTPKNESQPCRKVLFTHVDSFEFDPQMPCRFINLSRREKFYLSSNDELMQCLCHHHLRTNFTHKSKTKPKT